MSGFDPFGGNKALRGSFFEAVRIASELAEESTAVVPFATGLTGNERKMLSFPLPRREVVEAAMKICRDSDLDVWTLVWDGSVDVGNGMEDALCFRSAQKADDRSTTFYWKYTRSPNFKLVGNPGVLE